MVSGFMSNSYHQGKVLSGLMSKLHMIKKIIGPICRLNVIKKTKKNIGSMFRLNVQVICDKEKKGSMCRLSVQA